MKNDNYEISIKDYIKTVLFVLWYFTSFLWVGFVTFGGTVYLMASETYPIWIRITSGVLTLMTMMAILFPMFLQETTLKKRS